MKMVSYECGKFVGSELHCGHPFGIGGTVLGCGGRLLNTTLEWTRYDDCRLILLGIYCISDETE